MEKAVYEIKRRGQMILSDICEFIVDCPHTTAKDEGQGYPLIRTPNIGKGRLILNDVHRVSEAVYNNRNFRAVPQDGDLIFAREAPAGNVAIIKNGEKVCLGQRTVLLRPDKTLVDPNYLVYYLLAPNQQYKLLGSANGATVAHVNLPIIRNLSVDLPDMEKQRRIANALSTYDDLIENNQKQIKLLEEAAQRLYKEWFIDLRFPGYETTPVVDGIPQGWRVLAIGETFKTLLGGTPSREKSEYWENGTIPWINSGKVNELRVIQPSEYITEIALNKSATKLLPKHTTLVAITGATLGQVSYTEIETCANQSVVGIIDETQLYSEYIYCYILNNITSMIGKATGGAQQHINKDIVNNFPIVMPQESVLSVFQNIAKPYFEKINALLIENIELAEARDRLLPKLMSGEIEV